MKTFFSAAFLLFVMQACAQDTLQDKPGPHNGRIKTSGHFHIEMVNNYDGLFVYLYDSKMRCLGNQGLTAEGTFVFYDGTSYTIPLKPYGTESFSTGMNTSGFATARITFLLFGRTISAKFDNDVLVEKDPK